MLKYVMPNNLKGDECIIKHQVSIYTKERNVSSEQTIVLFGVSGHRYHISKSLAATIEVTSSWNVGIVIQEMVKETFLVSKCPFTTRLLTSELC